MLKRKLGRTNTSPSSLALGIDPSDVLSSTHHIQHHSTTLIDTILSTTFTATADIKMNVHPNQSLAPITETIQSGIISPPNEITVIPDMTSMPGGAPRSGNSFLAESFRELFNGPLKASTATQPNYQWNAQTDGSGANPIVIPAKEFDLVGRYADLLNRDPLAAAIYALVDFFLINAEEDVAIAELLDDTEGEEILEMEGSVVMTRFYGVAAVVLATVLISALTYHPVPFREL